jgi:tetratricopeptide (TPR) repeat protein
MKVVSSQRLYDLLKMMGREGVKVIDKTVASEVAQKAEAKYMILGKILATTPDLVITSQLVDVQTGNVVGSQRISGPNGTNIFSLVDSLSSEIRSDLEIPALAKKGKERPVADITTHSPEALRFFLEGNELSNKLYTKEATEKFEQAVKIDTTFASAYLQLGFCYFGLGDMVRARNSVEKAARFSDRVSRKEKFLIDAYHLMFQMRSLEAKRILEEMVGLYPDEKIAHRELALVNRLMKNYEEAIAGFNKVIELDSLDKEAYNFLAYAYDDVGRYDEAIQSIDKYIELAMGEANPYDTRGDIYAHQAEADKAIESYKKALEIKPDFETSIKNLGLMHLHKREYEKAERYFLQHGELGGKTAKSISRADLALIPLSQGKYDLAIKILGQGIAADELDRLYGQQVNKYDLQARIHIEKKEFDKALQCGQSMVGLMAEFYPEAVPYAKCLYGSLLAKAGELDSAQKVADEVGELFKDKAEFDKTEWHFLEFDIKYARGDVNQALKEIIKLTKARSNDFRMRYWLAATYLESDMIGEAVQEFETLSNWNVLSRARNPLLSSKIPYFLGVCYEKSGWERRAIEKYEEFLEIWKDADPGIPEVEDARERLEKLRAES